MRKTLVMTKTPLRKESDYLSQKKYVYILDYIKKDYMKNSENGLLDEKDEVTSYTDVN